MTEAIQELDENILIKESSILKLIKLWKSKQHTAGFNISENLIGLTNCMEHEITEFWGRDPDPFDERSPKRIPVALAYADIFNDLIEQNDFILNLVLKYILTRSDEEEHMELTLRFICSVLHCCGLSIIIGFEPDIKDRFYSKIFNLALSAESPNNVYATYIIGHITREDDQVIPQRKATLINIISQTMDRLEILNRTSEEKMNWTAMSENFLSADIASANVHGMSMSKICGVWKLQSPMNEASQERLLIFFLRHVGEFETLMPTMYTKGVLPLISSWIRGERHNDIRLTFEALRLLMKLLCHRLIYIEFYEQMDGVNLLFSIPRHTVAANVISFCLYNLVYSGEIVDRIINLPQTKLECIMKGLLWIIETCHPSARCYGMLCIQHLITKPVMLILFEELNGPRYILNLLTILPTMLGENKSTSIYYEFLKTTLNTMKVSLEQSLINWSLSADNTENNGLLAFPNESESLFPKNTVSCIALAMKLQTWKHSYISECSNIIKVIYSKSGFFEDAFTIFHEIINSTVDILSLLCVSNKFIVKFLDFTESDTKGTIKIIFDILTRKPSSTSGNNINVLKSILFFLGILCCRPLQGSRIPVQLNKSTKKRKYEDIDNSGVMDPVEKIRVTSQGIATKVAHINTINTPIKSQRINFHQELQNKLWKLIRCYNAIPKLLKILEAPLSPLDLFAIRTWVCHVLSGMSRCNDILLMLRKLPTFNKGIIENMMKESVTPERTAEHVEFCTIARRFIKDLRGESSSNAGDLLPNQIRKMEIVGRTQIKWENQELLNLIHHHLQHSGLNDVADLLRQRANLPIDDRGNLSLYEEKSEDDKIFNRLLHTPKRGVENRLSFMTSSTPKPISNDTSLTLKPKLYRDTINQTSIMTKSVAQTTGKTTTLNEIVESFLRNQHAQCSNPTSICPKFSLNTKHVCPTVEEYNKPTSVLNYITKRNYDFSHRSVNNNMLRRHVHQSFKPKVSLSESNVFVDDRFSEVFCFAKDLEDGLFFASENSLIVFTDVDLAEATVEIGEVGHMTSNLENSKNGRLLMASSVYSKRNNGEITLFNVETRCTAPTKMKKQHEYQFSGYSEFSKSDDTKFIVTQDKIAQVIDVETGSILYTCSTEDTNYNSVKNAFNRATFSYDDNLVLSYGTLWDVRCSNRDLSDSNNKFVHTFDMLENIVSGVFHPNGMDVIIGSAVWDVRRYQLVQNIPTLKSSRICFNQRGDFFYTYKDTTASYYSNRAIRGDNIFQCYDARDYSVVATVNTNKVIMSLAVDPKDLGVAVIETNDDFGMNAQCRVFNVGEKWTSTTSYDVDDDVDESEDDEMNDIDMEFAMNNGLNDFMVMSESDDLTIEDDTGDAAEEVDNYSSESDVASSDSDNDSDDGETEEFFDSEIESDSDFDSDSDY